MNKFDAALVALGTNAPHGNLEGAALLARAVEAMGEAGLAIGGVSSAWASPAWPPSDQPNYVNAVASIDAGDRAPGALYALLQDIEGGVRPGPHRALGAAHAGLGHRRSPRHAGRD
ncbi:MAG: 2-amino-4-hydroxy-6-hydroxymethyldihydropteridine diphosphokinase [Terricaulis sp.]